MKDHYNLDYLLCHWIGCDSERFFPLKTKSVTYDVMSCTTILSNTSSTCFTGKNAHCLIWQPTYQHIFCKTTMYHPLTSVVFFVRFFIGTSVSTFSFRIHEEREILGFDPKTTYNRFCGDDESECEQPTHWKIVY